MTQVFLSFARRDGAAVGTIKTALGQAGVSVFEEAAPSGDNLGEQFRRGLKLGGCVILVWSRAAVELPWAQEETRQAIRIWSSGRLVLAALDDSPLPTGLRDIAPIRVDGASPSGVARLIERVKAVVSASETTSKGSSTAPIAKTPTARPSLGGRPAAILGALIAIASLAGIGYVATPHRPAIPSASDTLPSPAAPPSKPPPPIDPASKAPALARARFPVADLPPAVVAMPYRAELPAFPDPQRQGLRITAESCLKASCSRTSAMAGA